MTAVSKGNGTNFEFIKDTYFSQTEKFYYIITFKYDLRVVVSLWDLKMHYKC